MAAVLVLCSAAVATAAYLAEEPQRSETDRGAEPAPMPKTSPPYMPVHPARAAVRAVEVGRPFSYLGLTMYPLELRGDAARHEVMTLEEASARGAIVIRERDTASVPEVEADNHSRSHVFLMAGDLIEGGKQNRIVRSDVLLAPRAHGVRIPVYCGEKERWTGRGDTFAGTGLLADAQLRKMAAAGEPQGGIWSTIDRRLESAAVKSSTSDYRGMYEENNIRRRLDDYSGRFRHICVPRTVGVVAVSGGRILGCDIVSDPALFSRLWDKICRSYAVQAVDSAGQGASTIGPGAGEIRRFLDGVFPADIFDGDTPGEGEFARISGAVEGSALVWRGRVLHMALFPAEVTILREEHIERFDEGEDER